MKRIDTSLLKNAMIDAAILRAENITRDDHEPIVVGNEYRNQWERSVHELQHQYRRKRRNTCVVALIVAAAILALTGCAWMYRIRIVKFFVSVFDQYDKVEYDMENVIYPQIIKEIYMPTSIMDGYEVMRQEQNLFKIRIEWIKNADQLVFVQTVKGTNSYSWDNEKGQYDIKNINQYEIIHYTYEGRQFYTWTTQYIFCLISTNELSEDELKIIISNIEKKEIIY